MRLPLATFLRVATARGLFHLVSFDLVVSVPPFAVSVLHSFLVLPVALERCVAQ